MRCAGYQQSTCCRWWATHPVSPAALGGGGGPAHRTRCDREDLDPDAVDALLDACVEPEADYLESETP
ncbi:hypothetical protein GS415_07025 [Rhodococcus hoagii]|nr:hypothetical protein [Prescottella equi]